MLSRSKKAFVGFVSLLIGICSAQFSSALVQAAGLGPGMPTFIVVRPDPTDYFEFTELSVDWSNTLVFPMYAGENGPRSSKLDAYLIAMDIAQKGLVTATGPGQSCLDACAIIWLAGEERILIDGTSVGFTGDMLSLTDEEYLILAQIILGEQIEDRGQLTGLEFLALGHFLQEIDIGFDFVLKYFSDWDGEAFELTVEELSADGIPVVRAPSLEAVVSYYTPG